MYRVCVGYVSGMYRENIEAYRVRRGFFDILVENYLHLLKIQRTERSEGAVAIESAALKKRI